MTTTIRRPANILSRSNPIITTKDPEAATATAARFIARGPNGVLEIDRDTRDETTYVLRFSPPEVDAEEAEIEPEVA